MKTVYIVTVEQGYACHFTVSRVFSSIRAACAYARSDPDYEIYACDVDGDYCEMVTPLTDEAINKLEWTGR